jgi:hypothetical protein
MPERLDRDGAGLRRQLIFIENSGMNFVTVYFNSLGSFNPKTNLPAFGAKHYDPNIGPYGHAFSPSACKNQHGGLPWLNMSNTDSLISDAVMIT